MSVSTLVLGASLIPTIRGDDKPALSTGILTTVFVGVIAVTMATMGLWISAGANLLIVLAWGTISLQKYRQLRGAWRSVIVAIEEELSSGIQKNEPRPDQARDEEPVVARSERR
ncbi:MAG: hypothetical protein AB7P33_08530 [Dehalococcoidia bacterium]